MRVQTAPTDSASTLKRRLYFQISLCIIPANRALPRVGYSEYRKGVALKRTKYRLV